MGDQDSIRFECPNCHKRLRAEGRAVGRKVRCPNEHCAQLVTVPNGKDASQPASQTSKQAPTTNKRPRGSKNWNQDRDIKDVIMFARGKTKHGNNMKLICDPALFEYADKAFGLNGLLARTVSEMHHSLFEEEPKGMKTKDDWDKLLKGRFDGYGWARLEVDTQDVTFNIVVITARPEEILDNGKSGKLSADMRQQICKDYNEIEEQEVSKRQTEVLDNAVVLPGQSHGQVAAMVLIQNEPRIRDQARKAALSEVAAKHNITQAQVLVILDDMRRAEDLQKAEEAGEPAKWWQFWK